MKKLFMLFITLFLLFPAMTFAASSFTVDGARYEVKSANGDTRVFEVYTGDWVCDAADASFTTALFVSNMTGKLYKIVFNPSGTTAPTDDYDIGILDGQLADISGGAGTDLDEALSKSSPAFIGAVPLEYVPVIKESLYLGLTGNEVNSAAGRVILYFEIFK